jgi:sugar phosphate isomerase/epimerase
MNFSEETGVPRRKFIKDLTLAAVTAAIPSLAGCHRSANRISQPSIGLQLWSVRNEIEQDLPGTLSWLADIGIKYVETAFFPEHISSADASRMLREKGLQVCSIHSELPEGNHKDQFQKLADTFECKNMVWHGWAEPQELWNVTVSKHKTEDGLKELADRYNKANEYARSIGLRLFLHNHWWECQPLDSGKRPYQILIDHMDTDIYFEVDIYWAKVAGINPAEMIQNIGNRVKLLHIKDGPAKSPDDFMVSAGSGTLDILTIASSAKDFAEYMIIEFDKCETDIFQAVKGSYDFLLKKGLARG